MRKALALGVVLIALAGLLLAVPRLLDRAEPVTLSNARSVPVPGQDGMGHLYLTISNGAAPDVLLSATSPDAHHAMIVGTDSQNGLAIPANSSPSLASDGAHIMLMRMTGAMEDGRLVPITLQFARSGELRTRAKITTVQMDHAMHMSGGQASPDPIPQLDMHVTQSQDGLWTVRLETVDFAFVPTAEPPEHVHGEGHGHLYLNGLKLQRMYGPDATIGRLPPGRHIVSVSLNGNTHMPYLTTEGPVATRAEITAE